MDIRSDWFRVLILLNAVAKISVQLLHFVQFQNGLFEQIEEEDIELCSCDFVFILVTGSMSLLRFHEMLLPSPSVIKY